MPYPSKCEPHADTIRAMWKDGANSAEIGRAIGVKHNMVYFWMKRRGMIVKKPAHTVKMLDNIQSIIEMRDKCASDDAIATALGVTPRQLRAFCDHKGIMTYKEEYAPRGKLAFSLFTADEILTLGKMAKEYGSPDMADVIVDCVRDAIAEFEAKAQKKRD
jgi:hypothetical protein